MGDTLFLSIIVLVSSFGASRLEPRVPVTRGLANHSLATPVPISETRNYQVFIRDSVGIGQESVTVGQPEMRCLSD